MKAIVVGHKGREGLSLVTSLLEQKSIARVVLLGEAGETVDLFKGMLGAEKLRNYPFPQNVDLVSDLGSRLEGFDMMFMIPTGMDLPVPAHDSKAPIRAGKKDEREVQKQQNGIMTKILNSKTHGGNKNITNKTEQEIACDLKVRFLAAFGFLAKSFKIKHTALVLSKAGDFKKLDEHLKESLNVCCQRLRIYDVRNFSDHRASPLNSTQNKNKKISKRRWSIFGKFSEQVKSRFGGKIAVHSKDLSMVMIAEAFHVLKSDQDLLGCKTLDMESIIFSAKDLAR